MYNKRIPQAVINWKVKRKRGERSLQEWMKQVKMNMTRVTKIFELEINDWGKQNSNRNTLCKL